MIYRFWLWTNNPDAGASPEWYAGYWYKMERDVYPFAVAITPHDSTNIPNGPVDAIYVGGAGVVRAVLNDDTVVAFTCVAGQILPIRAKRVNSTSTTATLLVALYQ